ncbi:Ycf66 family protein [Leptolyngbya sp. NIES-2104]|uniref:Ycf66 family protein n=1 Tax=Leptolyngbya sp. NIES-2104 TaxID=1552121 RepID=UPI00073EA847|nr:Ycf66 family protein [Leptolyngbya sp. NIES-2104]
MLTYLLALAIALGSFGLYMSAFFYPEIYRKGDLTLSGVGLFYALVLWICADRITGAVLLGQIASVSLIGWFGYQSLTSRLGYTPSTSELRSKLDDVLASENTAKVVEQGKKTFTTVKDRASALLNKAPATPPAEPYEPLRREDFGNPAPEAGKADVMGKISAVGTAIGSVFKKPEKNKTTYVRKEFREESAETDDAFNFEEDIVAAEKAIESNSVAIDQDGASESTSTADEIVQEEVAFEASHPQAVPPHPPTPELVEAAVEDAEEKDIPSDPPETV